MYRHLPLLCHSSRAVLRWCLNATACWQGSFAPCGGSFLTLMRGSPGGAIMSLHLAGVKIPYGCNVYRRWIISVSVSENSYTFSDVTVSRVLDMYPRRSLRIWPAGGAPFPDPPKSPGVHPLEVRLFAPAGWSLFALALRAPTFGPLGHLGPRLNDALVLNWHV